MKFKPFILVVALTLSPAFRDVLNSGEPANGTVMGVVTDLVGVRVNRVQVEFVGEHERRTAETDPDGAYTVHLAPGIYRPRVSRIGFCDVQRAAFMLAPNTEVEFDFELLDCPSETREIRIGEYREEELDAVMTDGLRPLVQYGAREKCSDLVCYSSLMHSTPPTYKDKKFPVVYTYNLLTLKATSLVYSPSDSSIQGTGDVVFQDGKTTRKGSKIRVVFRHGEPVVNLAE